MVMHGPQVGVPDTSCLFFASLMQWQVLRGPVCQEGLQGWLRCLPVKVICLQGREQARGGEDHRLCECTGTGWLQQGMALRQNWVMQKPAE